MIYKDQSSVDMVVNLDLYVVLFMLCRWSRLQYVIFEGSIKYKSSTWILNFRKARIDNPTPNHTNNAGKATENGIEETATCGSLYSDKWLFKFLWFWLVTKLIN